MFLFSESGQVSIHESRIYRIENTMKDLGIPFTREQAELFQKRYKENQSHLDKWFTEDQLIVSAGVGVVKPDVKIFRMAEEKWGMKPENTFMIGDSLENDIAGAKNAGWKTIWMNHHRYTVPEGMEKPDYIAYTEEELRKLIVQICFTTKKDG